MITVCILTKNSQKTIDKTLASLQNFSEVILLDNGSTDNTLSIAKNYTNVKVHTSTFTTFGELRNKAASFASHNWILALDSDEILSSALANEILKKSLDEKKIYSLPFLNFYRGKLVKCCGWYPERHARLYHKSHYAFEVNHVHEAIRFDPKDEVILNSYVYHTPYHSQEDFLRKMQLYSQLFAEQHRGKKSSLRKAILHSFAAFGKSFFLKRGMFHGEIGFTLSLYNANTAFYKYLKLREINASDTSLS